MSEFDDIRPYYDNEVPAVLQRVIADDELIDTLLGNKFPRLSKWIPWLLRPVARWKLRGVVRDMNSLSDFQDHFYQILHGVLDKSCDGYSFSGLDKLQTGTAYLFISNHRDIALDPLMVGLALRSVDRDTVRIAIGDNLLSKPYVAKLMRLNRCFVVKRSVTGRREKLEALKTLSRYIRHSITGDIASVWIAQKEGRSKDGNDKTETALLKMLALSWDNKSGDKEADFGAAIDQLNLIPVAISYEYDPCDADKGRELYAKASGEKYIKAEDEDVASIYKGLLGNKGRIHVSFGEVVKNTTDADSLAAEIDAQIYRTYKLFPSNIVAYEILGQRQDLDKLHALWPECDWQAVRDAFTERLESVPEAHRAIVLDGYARPVINQLNAQQD